MFCFFNGVLPLWEIREDWEELERAGEEVRRSERADSRRMIFVVDVFLFHDY